MDFVSTYTLNTNFDAWGNRRLATNQQRKDTVVDNTFTQDFNRYTYARNNPLMYTDPDGEWIHLVVGAVFGGFVNWATNGAEFTWKGLGYLGIGALAGALGAGVGAGISAAMAGSSFGAGFIGASTATATGAFAGATSGAGAGLVSGFTTGASNAWLGGANFNNGLKAGLQSGLIGGVIGGLIGGITGGIHAKSVETNFWTGKGTFDLSEGYACSSAGEHGIKDYIKTIKNAQWVGNFEGINVYEHVNLGRFKSGTYSGVTLPLKGIFVGQGVYSDPVQTMLKHEFGHVLQIRLIGIANYYKYVATTSLLSAYKNPPSIHKYTWTETWANYLSYNYFGKPKNWNMTDNPVKNINWWRLLLILGL
jgi:hypothetical protein